MPLIILGIVGIGATAWLVSSLGTATQEAGQGVQTASNGLSQLVLVAGGVYLGGKVLKAW